MWPLPLTSRACVSPSDTRQRPATGMRRSNGGPGNLGEVLALTRIHRRTPMDGVRTAAGWVRELQGRWLGSIGVDWRSADGLQSPHRAPMALRGSCDARENTQQGTLADRGGTSLRGRWGSCRLAVRPTSPWWRAKSGCRAVPTVARNATASSSMLSPMLRSNWALSGSVSYGP